MAHHKSTKKRIVLSKKQTLRNKTYKSQYKTTLKRIEDCTEKETAVEEFKKVTSLIDRLICKGILHKNTGARKKSQLALFVNSVA